MPGHGFEDHWDFRSEKLDNCAGRKIHSPLLGKVNSQRQNRRPVYVGNCDGGQTTHQVNRKKDVKLRRGTDKVQKYLTNNLKSTRFLPSPKL